MIDWIWRLFRSPHYRDIKRLREKESRDFLISSISYACLGGVEPWDCIPAVEGHEAMLSLFKVIGASKEWISYVEKRLKFVKMTEHLVGYHFAKDAPFPKSGPHPLMDRYYEIEENRKSWLDSCDQRFLNKIWGSLINRAPADTVPSKEEVALHFYPKPSNPKYANRDDGIRKAFQDLLEDKFYAKLEDEFATVR